MMNLCTDCLNEGFSHIYVEKSIKDTAFVKDILKRFNNAQIIEVNHYKDVFSRSGQNSNIQKKSQKLILARKTGELIYKGAPVCQNFGNDFFYYTSCVMNCIYDCEYCYLKGMYPSGNLVIFVNIEDIFEELKRLLEHHPVYLCVSYDTDLMALEGLLGYAAKWADFTDKMNKEGKQLTIEIRTKSANSGLFAKLPIVKNVIYAFTLSPEQVVTDYENKTPGTMLRIQAAKTAMEMGHTVRLCFDPMIYCKDWKKQYNNMLKMVFDTIDMDKIMDVSVGSFRISQDYLKKMRKIEPESLIAQFPYVNTGGYYHYPQELLMEMEGFLVERLSLKLPENKIFRW